MFYPVSLKSGQAYMHFNQKIQLFSADHIILKSLALESILEFDPSETTFFELVLISGAHIEFQTHHFKEINGILRDTCCNPLTFNASVEDVKTEVEISENSIKIGGFRCPVEKICAYKRNGTGICLKLKDRIIFLTCGPECAEAIEHAVIVCSTNQAIVEKANKQMSFVASLEVTDSEPPFIRMVKEENPSLKPLYKLPPRQMNMVARIMPQFMARNNKDFEIGGEQGSHVETRLEQSFGDCQNRDDEDLRNDREIKSIIMEETVFLGNLECSAENVPKPKPTPLIEKSSLWKTQYLGGSLSGSAELSPNAHRRLTYPFFVPQSVHLQDEEAAPQKALSPNQTRDFVINTPQHDNFQNHNAISSEKPEDLALTRRNATSQLEVSYIEPLCQNKVHSNASESKVLSVSSEHPSVMSIEESQEEYTLPDESTTSESWEECYDPCAVRLLSQIKSSDCYLELIRGRPECTFSLAANAFMQEVTEICVEKLQFSEVVAGSDYFSDAALKDPEKQRRKCILNYNGPCLYIRGTTNGQLGNWLFECQRDWGRCIKRAVDACYIVE